MQASASVSLVLSSILCLLLKTVRSTATGFERVEVTADYSQQPPQRNMSCHRCTRSIHGDNCLTVENGTALDIQHCTMEKKFCKVERKWEDGKFITFMRECARQCQSGCRSSGAALGYEIKICNECCRHGAFCNSQPYLLDGSPDKLTGNGSGTNSLLFGMVTGLCLCLLNR